MKKWSVITLLAGVVAFTMFASVVSAQDVPVIPDIESWERVLETKISPSGDDPFFSKIYQNRHGDLGFVVWYRDLRTNAIIPFIKVWGLKYALDYNGSFSALLLLDGTWIVGNKGEQVIITLVEMDDKEGLSVTVGFNGEHSWASRKIIVELPESDDSLKQ